MNDVGTSEVSGEEKRNADEEERYYFNSESPNFDICSVTYIFSFSPLCVCLCVCRSACVSGILKKMEVFQDYLHQHRDLINLVAKIVLATGTFFFFQSSFTGTNMRVQCVREDFHSSSIFLTSPLFLGAGGGDVGF